MFVVLKPGRGHIDPALIGEDDRGGAEFFVGMDDAEKIAFDMQKRPFLKPSEIYWLLSGLDTEGLLYLMTIARKRYIQQAVSLFVTTLRKATPMVTGDELKAMGYLPGPQFRVMRNHLIEMQLDGEVSTHEQALAFIRATYPVTPRPT